MKRFLFNLTIAFESVLSNTVRSILTALGIIFGVAAVIAMLAIGTGAQLEIMEQIRLVGVNNIVVTPVIEQKEEKVDEETTKNQNTPNYSQGLDLLDLESIRSIIPGIERSSPEILVETTIINRGVRRSAKIVGVENDYFNLFDYHLAKGTYFDEDQVDRGLPVCIIGSMVESRFFPGESAVGKYIKVGRNWLKVIGVLRERSFGGKVSDIGNLGIRDFNMDIYAPVKTVLLRYRNRALVNNTLLMRARMEQEGEQQESQSNNYHQLDKIIVQMSATGQLMPARNVMAKLLQRRHHGTIDYEITVPELLLKQQQKTKSIFNFVLGAIAGISLVVGGIGIMNIMLASVLERIKEIGLRMALGAKKGDIVYQFLFEAVIISVTGGILGIILGVSIAWSVAAIAEIPTKVTFLSVLLSFGVAATVGLIFGISPARRAAENDPITSLRYE